MTKNIVVISVEEHPELTLDELCHTLGVTPDFIQEVIEYGVVEPEGDALQALRFDEEHLRRIKTVVHLRRDLEINMAGAALVTDLLDQMEEMRAQLEFFQKYFKT